MARNHLKKPCFLSFYLLIYLFIHVFIHGGICSFAWDHNLNTFAASAPPWLMLEPPDLATSCALQVSNPTPSSLPSSTPSRPSCPSRSPSSSSWSPWPSRSTVHRWAHLHPNHHCCVWKTLGHVSGPRNHRFSPSLLPVSATACKAPLDMLQKKN